VLSLQGTEVRLAKCAQPPQRGACIHCPLLPVVPPNHFELIAVLMTGAIESYGDLAAHS